jgi:PAS domain S-box-containing protein
MAKIGGWELDPQTRDVRWTEQTYRIHGVSSDYDPPLDEAIEFFHPDDREQLRRALGRAIDQGEPYDLELRFITAQGEHLWVRTQGQPQETAGQTELLKGTIQDITKAKQLEQTLRRTSERLQIQHEIDKAILRARSPEEIAHAALTRLDRLIPCRHVGTSEIDPAQQRGRELIRLVDGKVHGKTSPWRPISHIDVRLIGTIQKGRIHHITDITTLDQVSPLERSLDAAGIRSYVSVPLMVQDTAIGTLNAGSEQPDFFSAMHVEIMEEVATSLAVALKQARLLEQTRRDAETQALLLREANHRVKNNLDAIIGLLYVERRHAPPEALPAYRPIIKNLIQRITGLAQVHQMLSESKWSPLFLSELAEQIIGTTARGAPDTLGFTLDVTPSTVRVSPAQSQHLALILSELTTNTLKYAGQDRDTIHITVQIAQKDDTVTLTYKNDGPDYPEDVLNLTRTSTGLTIIERLVEKNLRGKLALRNAEGAVTEIRFKGESL